MDTITIVALVFFALGLGVLYAPALVWRQGERLTRAEFIQAYPNFAWLRWWEPIFTILSLLVVFLPYVVFMNIFKDKAESIYVIVTLLAGMAIPNGLFAILTGICPVPTKSRYFYVYGGKTRLVGLLQILFAFVIIAIAVFLAFRST